MSSLTTFLFTASHYLKGEIHHLVSYMFISIYKRPQIQTQSIHKHLLPCSRSNTDIPVVKSEATAATESHTLVLQPSQTKMSSLEVQSSSKSSIWGLPGLDKDTFYAAALYLHAARGELNVRPLFHLVETPEDTRFFLDRFADCFARSKLSDARDHVSATAMVRNEKDKVITIYIAKNQSEKGCQSFASQEELGNIVNENESFAKQLVDWFSKLANDDTLQVNDFDLDGHVDIFKTMCRFSWSRLEHYISTISESNIHALERDVLVNLPKCCDGWEMAKFFINECQLYHDMKSRLSNSGGAKICLLTTYAHLAGQIRNYPDFRTLTQTIETSLSRPKLKDLAQAVKWINHLGRLLAAFTSFHRFCRDTKQNRYSFRHLLLRSEEDDWNGDTYRKKIHSWTGDLGLTSKREVRRFVKGQHVLEDRSVESLMNDIVETTGTKARVHCEMQLLIHFSQPGREKCLDYFGCSKKSCWMCWQMISQNNKYSMKNTHRKLFPRWAFPFQFSPSQPSITEGLRATYNEMLILIQDQIISPRPPSTIEPYPQTSARMTPAHQRRWTGDDLGPGLLSGWFSSNVITVPERFPVVRVPALYLPADDDSLENFRQVSIDAYEPDRSDLAEDCLMEPQDFAGKKIMFAFQLLTKPKRASFVADAVGFQKYVWANLEFQDDDWRNIRWQLWYRPSGGGMAPNPHILSIWGNPYGQERRLFPWKGDIFIIPLDARLSGRRTEAMQEPFAFNHASCLSCLERYLTDMKLTNKGPFHANQFMELNLIDVRQKAVYYKQGIADDLENQKQKRIAMVFSNLKVLMWTVRFLKNYTAIKKKELRYRISALEDEAITLGNAKNSMAAREKEPRDGMSALDNEAIPLEDLENSMAAKLKELRDGIGFLDHEASTLKDLENSIAAKEKELRDGVGILDNEPITFEALKKGMFADFKKLEDDLKELMEFRDQMDHLYR